MCGSVRQAEMMLEGGYRRVDGSCRVQFIFEKWNLPGEHRLLCMESSLDSPANLPSKPTLHPALCLLHGVIIQHLLIRHRQVDELVDRVHQHLPRVGYLLPVLA